jgi:DnaJ-class molecular chaperone
MRSSGIPVTVTTWTKAVCRQCHGKGKNWLGIKCKKCNGAGSNMEEFKTFDLMSNEEFESRKVQVETVSNYFDALADM